MPRAVVSGLGPNGMLATLRLVQAGYEVTAVEQRVSYGRSIHLCLRRGYLEDLEALDGVLRSKLEPIMCSIEAIEHIKTERIVSHPSREASLLPEAGVAERLAKAPSVLVRLDELERVFFGHLSELRSQAGLRILRGAPLKVEAGARECYSVRVGDELVSAPEIIVVAEGGKSSTARQLGRAPERLSGPKLYLSVHVDAAVGPISRRIDTEVSVGEQHVPVCFWATGHRDPKKGTWIVLEVPAALHAGQGSQSFDRGYFEAASRQLLECETAPAPSPAGLRGTFRFEQQLLVDPVAGKNLVFFGDVAGMGHHALGTGLELGASDLRALGALIAGEVGSGLGAYRRALVESRVALLAFGLREYHPDLVEDPSPWIRQALVEKANDPGLETRRWLDRHIAASIQARLTA